MYEDLILELEELFQGSFVNKYNEDLEEALKEILPEGTSITSTVIGFDEEGLCGATSISLVTAEDENDIGVAAIENINHEHYLITWELSWERFFKHIQYLAEGWNINW